MPKKKRILKFEDLIRFSMPERGIGKAKIKLNMAGEVSMSSVIVRSISEANENMLADFRHSEDYKLIMIKPGENGDFKFPRTGLKKFKRVERNNAEIRISSAGGLLYGVG